MHVLCADGADPVEKDAALYVRGDLPSAMQGWMLCGDLSGSLCFPAFMSNTPETDEVAVQRVEAGRTVEAQRNIPPHRRPAWGLWP